MMVGGKEKLKNKDFNDSNEYCHPFDLSKMLTEYLSFSLEIKVIKVDIPDRCNCIFGDCNNKLYSEILTP